MIGARVCQHLIAHRYQVSVASPDFRVFGDGYLSALFSNGLAFAT
jgi:hypothetical protein